MRFLYGDLSEFPLQENTLDLLKRFVDMAVEVLKLDLKINSARQAIEEDKQFLGEAIQDIDSFHQTLQEAIHQVTDNRSDDDVVAILAQGAADNFAKYITDGKGRVVVRVEQRIAGTQNMIEQVSVAIIGHLRNFFMQSGIPISGNALHCALEGERYTAHCEILDVTGIRCSYLLNPQSSEFFSTPKRLGDLLPGKQEFPIGTKQSRFKKAPVTDYIRIDEAVIYQVTENDELGEYRLAKRGGNGVEGLCIRIDKSKDGGLSVLRIDPDGNRHPVPPDVLKGANTEILVEAWKLLMPQVVALYRTRGDLSAINVDGKDIIQNRLIKETITRLVRFLSPTIREIGARSPAAEELCLKIDHETGKREEIYIPKKQLIDRFAELPENLRSLFAPLGIEKKIEEKKDDDFEGEFEGPPTEPNA
ncbi:hypothetical protein ACFL2F_01310 [Myxococcota bacterium]